jgi:hypothetical protein
MCGFHPAQFRSFHRLVRRAKNVPRASSCSSLSHASASGCGLALVRGPLGSPHAVLSQLCFSTAGLAAPWPMSGETAQALARPPLWCCVLADPLRIITVPRATSLPFSGCRMPVHSATALSYLRTALLRPAPRGCVCIWLPKWTHDTPTWVDTATQSAPLPAREPRIVDSPFDSPIVTRTKRRARRGEGHPRPVSCLMLS